MSSSTPPPSDASDLPLGAAWHVPEAPAAEATTPTDLAERIRAAALDLGFTRVGFCSVERFDGADVALRAWLAAGRHGEMAYLAGTPRAEPRSLLPAARSLVVVALPYSRDHGMTGSSAGGARLPLSGLVARYARGADYHHVLRERLRQLADRCAAIAGRPVLARPCVDTAPLLEREAARRAGIGFTAKSTMTIVPGTGSYVLLGELLLDLDLASTISPATAGCGGCRTCLDACPTRAFVDAYTLDARRCISYLTIELRGPIPRELRPMIGRWVFGCDICQEVCPFNHSPKPRTADPALRPRPALTDPDLVALLELTTSAHRRLVRGTALTRVSRQRLQRNAAVALGNTRSPAAVAALAKSARENVSPLVRSHAAWALGRIGSAKAFDVLAELRISEQDADVIEEIEYASGLPPRQPERDGLNT